MTRPVLPVRAAVADGGGALVEHRIDAEDRVDAGERPRSDEVEVTWSRRQRAVGFGVATIGMLVIVATIVGSGVALHSWDFRNSYQLINLPDLSRDPLGSVWHLHTQPPLYNLVVGSVARWSPFPTFGTLFVLHMAVLVGTGLLLTDLLSRWRVHPVAAALASVIALANPNLIVSLRIGSYEVPVTFLLVASVWWFQRALRRPGLVSLVGLSGTLTTLVLTRSLFHPVFLVSLVVLAAVARRAQWQHVVVALAIPLVLVGGWMAKNQVLFDRPTLSSWVGFNLQRGVVGPMDRRQVTRDVAEGQVTSLARQKPWQALSEYRPWLDGCQPHHANPAVSRPIKFFERGLPIPNFNHECYLPLYRESEANAVKMVRRHPGRYLQTRAPALVFSFTVSTVEGGGTFQGASRSWMDAVADRALVPYDTHLDLRGWNLPIFGDLVVTAKVSLTLVVLAAGTVLRGLLAASRLLRSGWKDRAVTWSSSELLWLSVAATVVLVVVVGDLIEFGENGRFRSVVDPFLVALPLGALARIVSARWPVRHTPAPARSRS